MPNTKKQTIIENLQERLKESHRREEILNKQCNDQAEKIIELRTELVGKESEVKTLRSILDEKVDNEHYLEGKNHGMSEAIRLFNLRDKD